MHAHTLHSTQPHSQQCNFLHIFALTCNPAAGASPATEVSIRQKGTQEFSQLDAVTRCLLHERCSNCRGWGNEEDLRAPNDLGYVVNAVCQLSKLLAASKAGCNVTQAGQVLGKNHRANQAVVTWCVHDALLVLNGPSGGRHTLCEAYKHLQQSLWLQYLDCADMQLPVVEFVA